MPSETAALLKSLGVPRTWEVTCPACHGRPNRTEGCWSSHSIPRVVWTCPNCNGEGTVTVQKARATHAE